jgi:DNA repair exonuclease SbcCD ATPase subunit
MITLAHLSVRNFKSLREVDLSFPRRGSILVEGFNEAGKSTLFESVFVGLYGEPLIAEETGARGRGRFDSVINYRSDTASIVLTLDVDGTMLRVERTLRRNRTGDARLEITYPDGTPEEVVGIRPVGERLIQELGSLDKETLLNSCFVEQKKLSKLEDLSGPARKESLEHLLNLDKLQALHDEVRVTPQDRATVQNAQQRLSLAEIQSQLPVFQAQVATLQLKQTAVALHVLLETIAEHERRQDDLAEQRKYLDAQRAAWLSKQERIAEVKAARDTIRVLATSRLDLDREEQQILDVSARLQRLDQQEQTELPVLHRRLASIEDLRTVLQRFDEQGNSLRDLKTTQSAMEQELVNIDERTDELERLTKTITTTLAEIDERARSIDESEQRVRQGIEELSTQQTALQHIKDLLDQKATIERELVVATQAGEAARAQVESHAQLLADITRLEAEEGQILATLREADTAYKDAQQVEAGLRVADALSQWLQGQRDSEAMNTGQATRDELEQQVSVATVEHARCRTAARNALIPIVVLALLAFISLVAGVLLFVFVGPPWSIVAIGAGVLGFVIAALLIPRWRRTRIALRDAQSSLDTARQAQNDFNAKHAALEALGGGQARVTEAERLLRDMDEVIPGSIADAEARISLLRPDNASDITVARTHLEELRSARDAVKGQHRDIGTRLTMLREQSRQHPGTQPEVIAQASNLDRPQELVARKDAIELQLTDEATAYPIAPDHEAVNEALRDVAEELDQQRMTLAAIPSQRENVALQRQHVATQQQTLAEMQSWLGDHPREVVEQRRREQEALIAQHEQDYEGQRAIVTQAAAELGIPADSGTVSEFRGSAIEQIKRLENELAERPRLAAEHDKLTGQVAQAREQLIVGWHACQPLPQHAVAPDLDLPTISDFVAIEVELTTALAVLDEPQVQHELMELANVEGMITNQEQAARDEIRKLQNEIAERLATIELTAAPTLDAIAAIFPLILEVRRTDAERLSAEIDATRANLMAARQRGEELAAQLGLQGVILDVATCAAERDACQYELEVKTQAERIVKGVRERMVQKVLPNTERNMCLLLPLLTADHYRDCQLTPDYKLQVWDENAGRYVAKNIFSGGTRDQLSLALRLAFALATLPEELGTTPGFIFLDEPLSSFDGPRTEALVTLLTSGQIAANFSQIFVISHNRMFDRNAFTHHLVMDGGQVVEHDFDRELATTKLGRVPANVPL